MPPSIPPWMCADDGLLFDEQLAPGADLVPTGDAGFTGNAGIDDDDEGMPLGLDSPPGSPAATTHASLRDRWRRRGAGAAGGTASSAAELDSPLSPLAHLPASASASAVASGAPPALPAAKRASTGGDEVLSGQRMYARLVLGSQKHTSFIKKARANGTVNWQQVRFGAVE